MTNQQLTQNLFTKPQHWTSTLKNVSVPLIYKTSTYWLSGGDLIAIGAEYHSQCLVSLYNRDRDSDKASTSHDDCNTNTAKRTAFAELVSYVEAALQDKDTSPVFQLSVVKKLYIDRVDQLGGDSSVI